MNKVWPKVEEDYRFSYDDYNDNDPLVNKFGGYIAHYVASVRPLGKTKGYFDDSLCIWRWRGFELITEPFC